MPAIALAVPLLPGKTGADRLAMQSCRHGERKRPAKVPAGAQASPGKRCGSSRASRLTPPPISQAHSAAQLVSVRMPCSWNRRCLHGRGRRSVPCCQAPAARRDATTTGLSDAAHAISK